ncbi:MAG: class I SAM-dependent rRNA methyltransferase [Planctomycetota bacterium]
MISYGDVALTEHAARLLGRGQAWFFADDIERVDAPPTSLGHGSLVRVHDGRGHVSALGFLSTASKIRLRVCAFGPVPDDLDPAAWVRAQLTRAVARRAGFDPGAGVRLVHGEGDGLPGLVVDRYADLLVLQVTVPLLEGAYDVLVPALVELTGAAVVLARNDVRVRELEGLRREVLLLHGKRVETVAIVEDGVEHTVDPWSGHKTGFYLDQRLARRRVRELAAGKDVLDTFAYQGGFALAALRGGARSCLAVDQSETALARAEAAAARNGLGGLETRAANVFDVLRELRAAGRSFDLVVVDPPAFAKSKREAEGAMRGYRDLNGHAMRLLRPGGLLLTCSCSHHMGAAAFETVLRQAAAGLPFSFVLRERIMADVDHPVWLNLPQSEYLKVILLERSA